MKKIFLVFVVTVMAVALSACGENLSSTEATDPVKSSEQQAESTIKKAPKETSKKTIEAATTLASVSKGNFEETVEQDVEVTVAAITAEYENLIATVDSFDRYVENANEIEAFYENTIASHEALCKRMMEYALEWTKETISSDKSSKDKYKEVEDIYDSVYDDGGDDIYDGVYDGVLDDIYDDFYDGILDDAYDTVEYKVWSDTRSNEYKMWSNARSETYEQWSDFRSDVYSFYSDIRSALYKDDNEKVEKVISKFQTKVDKLNGKDISNGTSEETTKAAAGDLPANGDLDSVVSWIESRFETACEDISGRGQAIIDSVGESYDNYKNNVSAIETFYAENYTKAEELYEEIRTASIDYYKTTAAESTEYSDWNDALDEYYDAWNDGMDDYYDAWDDMYGDMYKLFDSIITMDNIPDYSEYSDAWSEMYENYSNNWSDMYELYSDNWSDRYEDYFDVWGEFYKDNFDVDAILKLQ